MSTAVGKLDKKHQSDVDNEHREGFVSPDQERTKRQSVALVPSDIASLAQSFLLLFNPALFPHKPPPPPVANRVLFTDTEDR